MAEAVSGVRQRSVLGPILFVIYVNDLTGNLTIDHLLYADDVKLIAHRKQSVALQSPCSLVLNGPRIGSKYSTLPKVSTSPFGILPILLLFP